MLHRDESHGCRRLVEHAEWGGRHAPSEFYLACWIVPQRQMLIEAPPVIRENFDRETATNVSSEESSGLHWYAAQYLASNV